METFFQTREEWLGFAAAEIAPIFAAHGYKLPTKLRFSCSWPAGSRGGKTTLGQCVASTASGDGTTEVYIVPTVADPAMALGVLVHELVHAAVGVDQKHNRVFAAACSALGLVGKATEALPGEDLQRRLAEEVLPVLGSYPHAAVNLNDRPKQSTRMIKVVCPVLRDAKDKPYMLRMTRAWIDLYGLPTSPAGVQMVEDGADDNEAGE